MARVYVGNLDSCVTEHDLEDEFCAFGIIRSVWIARRPLGYAFIDFDDRSDAQDAIRELNAGVFCGRIEVAFDDFEWQNAFHLIKQGKMDEELELSHNSSGGRGGRSGGSDFNCYQCGEPGHFARECHLRVGSQRCQRHPRSRRSPSNGRRFFTVASSERSLTPTHLRATQMDSEELNDRIVKLGNQMSELKKLVPRFHLIKELWRPPPPAEVTASASAPKELDVGFNGRLVLNDGPSNAPDVEELNPVIPKIVARREEDRNNKRIAKLEEKLRLLQGLDRIEDLSYYAKFQAPETFNMPKFNKYDSSGNPIVHLNHFMMKMARHAENGPLMILAFQYSLTGPALRWFFMCRVHMLDTWEEVSDAFLLPYKFNLDLAPTCDDLRRAEMKRGESFGAYARRWHGLAAQVWPALSDKETTDLFVRTLPLEYFIRMIGCDTFPNIVMVGEHIEGAIRDGQMAA